MNENKACQSCGMTIDDGTYCQHCTDENGNLQTFEERLERMTQWLRRQEPDASPEDAQQKALIAMAQLPAWRNQPQVKAMRK